MPVFLIIIEKNYSRILNEVVENIENVLSEFPGISLVQMDDVSMLKRTDTKFVLPQKLLPEILKSVAQNYRILEINGRRLMNYKSLYFDTPNFKFYSDHHNGKLKRTKIRIRQYVDSNLHFLEIKIKDGKGRTVKTRMRISEFDTDIGNTQAEFIREVTNCHFDLEPTLWNDFRRFTHVDNALTERITIDVGLAFQLEGNKKEFSDLVVVELKQVRYDRKSDIAKVLKKHSIYPYGFSKYCLGMTQLYKDIKYNAFKPKLLKIKKLTA